MMSAGKAVTATGTLSKPVENVEHIKTYVQVMIACIIIGGSVKVIVDIKKDVNELRSAMNEKFNATDVKIDKLQTSIDAKFDAFRAETGIKAMKRA